MNKDSGSTVSGWVLLQAPVDVANGSSEEKYDDDYDKGNTSVNSSALLCISNGAKLTSDDICGEALR